MKAFCCCGADHAAPTAPNLVTSLSKLWSQWLENLPNNLIDMLGKSDQWLCWSMVVLKTAKGLLEGPDYRADQNYCLVGWSWFSLIAEQVKTSVWWVGHIVWSQRRSKVQNYSLASDTYDLKADLLNIASRRMRICMVVTSSPNCVTTVSFPKPATARTNDEK